MPFTHVEVQLTDEQVAEIEAVIGDSDQQFALLAHPQVRGPHAGSMPIYIVTAAQYKAIDKGVIEARGMEAFK